MARRLGRVPHPYTREDLCFFMEQVIPREPTWALMLRASQELVGIMGLAPQPGGQSAELGYYLAPRYWGQGLATEAGQVVVRWGFQVLGITRMTSGYHIDNPASGRVLAKLGFKPAGQVSRPCLAEGRDKPSFEVELQV